MKGADVPARGGKPEVSVMEGRVNQDRREPSAMPGSAQRSS